MSSVKKFDGNFRENCIEKENIFNCFFFFFLHFKMWIQKARYTKNRNISRKGINLRAKVNRKFRIIIFKSLCCIV